jgi:hypothetical protein
MFATPLSGAAWVCGADSASVDQVSTIASIETRARMVANATERNLLLTIKSFLFVLLQVFQGVGYFPSRTSYQDRPQPVFHASKPCVNKVLV